MTRAPRVAQLANFLTPTSGGLRVVVDELARGVLDGGGHRLRLTPDPGKDRGTTTGSTKAGGGGRRERAAEATGPGARDRSLTIPGPTLPGSGNRYQLLLDRATVRRELAAFGPDLIEVHDQTTLTWTGSWARRNGVPAVLVAHERLDHLVARTTGLPPRFLGPAARRWAARLACGFDAVVCASDYAAEPFGAAGARNLYKIPFGVDLQTFTPRPRTDDPTWPAGTLRLVLAARLSTEKSPGTALDMLARLLAELLMPEVGLAVRTAEEMAHAVVALAARPAARRLARTHAEQYSWPRVRSAFADLRAALIRCARSEPGPVGGERSGQVAAPWSRVKANVW